MKKLIALTLMVACLACFSLGCGKKDTKPVTGGGTTTESTTGGEASTEGGSTETTPEAE